MNKPRLRSRVRRSGWTHRIHRSTSMRPPRRCHECGGPGPFVYFANPMVHWVGFWGCIECKHGNMASAVAKEAETT